MSLAKFINLTKTGRMRRRPIISSTFFTSCFPPFCWCQMHATLVEINLIFAACLISVHRRNFNLSPSMNSGHVLMHPEHDLIQI